MKDSDDPLLVVYLNRRSELIRYFHARLGSPDAANDLVQDIYLRLKQRPPAPVDNPAAYLFRLGRNLMLDQIKQDRRTAKRETDWRQAETSTIGGQDIDPAIPVDNSLAARQRLREIIDVVNELPPTAREAFRLHKLEGLSHGETATAMGVSRSSVEKYIMTSLRRILSRGLGSEMIQRGVGGSSPSVSSLRQGIGAASEDSESK